MYSKKSLADYMKGSEEDDSREPEVKEEGEDEAFDMKRKLFLAKTALEDQDPKALIKLILACRE